MKRLLVLDARNYMECMSEIQRISVRGIIFKGDQLLLVKTNFGELCLPGGGVEEGENDIEALVREVKEETGYQVKVDSIKKFGEVEEKRLSTHEPMIWHQFNRLYFCEVEDEQGECQYTENEKKYGFCMEWHTLEEAIKINQMMLSREGKKSNNQREYETFLLIKSYMQENAFF